MHQQPRLVFQRCKALRKDFAKCDDLPLLLGIGALSLHDHLCGGRMGFGGLMFIKVALQRQNVFLKTIGFARQRI